MSVEKTDSRTGLRTKCDGSTPVCITREGSRPRGRREIRPHIKDLKAAGELHLLDEEPRGTITLRDYIHEVW